VTGRKGYGDKVTTLLGEREPLWEQFDANCEGARNKHRQVLD